MAAIVARSQIPYVPFHEWFEESIKEVNGLLSIPDQPALVTASLLQKKVHLLDMGIADSQNKESFFQSIFSKIVNDHKMPQSTKDDYFQRFRTCNARSNELLTEKKQTWNKLFQLVIDEMPKAKMTH